MDSPGEYLYNRPHQGTFARFWVDHRFNVIAYSGLAITILFVYHLFSDGDFSFLLTLGSMFTMLSFILIIIKIVRHKECSGISLKSIQCFAVAFACRLTSILLYEGYLPYDRTGDHFYRLTEVLSLLLCGVIILLMVGVYKTSYTVAFDQFGQDIIGKELGGKFGALVAIVPAFLVAVVFHPSLNGNFVTDTLWAMSSYLESLAVLPQWLLVYRRGGAVEEFNATSVFTMFVARLLNLWFWVWSFTELNDKYASGASIHKAYPGHIVLLAQLVSLAFLSLFAFQYIKAAKSGKGMRILPI